MTKQEGLNNNRDEEKFEQEKNNEIFNKAIKNAENYSTPKPPEIKKEDESAMVKEVREHLEGKNPFEDSPFSGNEEQQQSDDVKPERKLAAKPKQPKSPLKRFVQKMSLTLAAGLAGIGFGSGAKAEYPNSANIPNVASASEGEEAVKLLTEYYKQELNDKKPKTEKKEIESLAKGTYAENTPEFREKENKEAVKLIRELYSLPAKNNAEKAQKGEREMLKFMRSRQMSFLPVSKKEDWLGLEEGPSSQDAYMGGLEVLKANLNSMINTRFNNIRQGDKTSSDKEIMDRINDDLNSRPGIANLRGRIEQFCK